MTEVEFHTGIDDRQAFACRLLRKASAAGARVVVRAAVTSGKPAEIGDERAFPVTRGERCRGCHAGGEVLGVLTVGAVRTRAPAEARRRRHRSGSSNIWPTRRTMRCCSTWAMMLQMVSSRSRD